MSKLISDMWAVLFFGTMFTLYFMNPAHLENITLPAVVLAAALTGFTAFLMARLLHPLIAAKNTA